MSYNKYPKNILKIADLTVVREGDEKISQWIAQANRPVSRIVEKEVDGRVRKFQETKPAHIVIGTGLRTQHMPARALCTQAPALPSEWYGEENEKNREFDPFGVYTQTGIKLITDFYVKQFEQLGATAFVGGGATMADQMMMRAAQKLGLKTMLKVPIPTQHAGWPEHVQGIFIAQAKKADVVVLVSSMDEVMGEDGKTDKRKVAYAMNRRNRAMLTIDPHTRITAKRTVMATWRGASGGTKNCIEDAVKMGLPVINVYDALLATLGHTPNPVRGNSSMPALIETEAFDTQTLKQTLLNISDVSTKGLSSNVLIQVAVLKLQASLIMHALNEDASSGPQSHDVIMQMRSYNLRTLPLEAALTMKLWKLAAEALYEEKTADRASTSHPFSYLKPKVKETHEQTEANAAD